MLRERCTKQALCRLRPNRRREAAERTSLRLFLCARCRDQVVICRRCDRGQIYCTKACAQEARRINQREAGRRYQSSEGGRANHAERSRRYRVRKKNVTHQGSVSGPDLPPVGSTVGSPAAAAVQGTTTQCHWCGSCCSQFLRLGFLRRHRGFRGVTPAIRQGSGCDRPP
jgi:hypothetical protein